MIGCLRKLRARGWIRKRIREFLLGRSQRVSVGGQLSEEIGVTSGVQQGSVVDSHLFPACVNNTWRDMESTIKLFADNCITYRKTMNYSNIEKCCK